MKSLKFFKPALATTLGIVLGWLLSVRPAEAGYTVTLQEVGPDVVATGSGALNLTGLTFSQYASQHVGLFNPKIHPGAGDGDFARGIATGPTSSSVDLYFGYPETTISGPTSFGSGGLTLASSGSGDMVGTSLWCFGLDCSSYLIVPRGYVSGTFLSNSATYSGKTFATLGVTPGTYVWTWGTGANQNFTLKIGTAVSPRLSNISTRTFVQTGDNVMIGGLIITGSAQKRVIVRAIGPSLAQHGITNPLQNPTLELHDHTGALIASNDNWMDAPNRQEIIDSGLAPSNNLESAILMSLSPNNYTAIVRGVNNGTGIGLVEAYDLDPTASSKLGNISTRALVQTGDNVMIGGLIITGSGQKNVIVRAIGPSLSQQGITNPLLDPTLELHDMNGAVIAFDENWRDTQESEIEATNLAPSDDRESAIVKTLTPGNYTAIVRGKNNTIGVTLVEVYDLD